MSFACHSFLPWPQNMACDHDQNTWVVFNCPASAVHHFVAMVLHNFLVGIQDRLYFPPLASALPPHDSVILFLTRINYNPPYLVLHYFVMTHDGVALFLRWLGSQKDCLLLPLSILRCDDIALFLRRIAESLNSLYFVHLAHWPFIVWCTTFRVALLLYSSFVEFSFS